MEETVRGDNNLYTSSNSRGWDGLHIWHEQGWQILAGKLEGKR